MNNPSRGQLRGMVFLAVFFALFLRAETSWAALVCTECHSQDDLFEAMSLDREASQKLGPGEALKRSAHAKLACQDCHRNIKGKPEDDLPHEKPAPADCGHCHGETSRLYAGSIHGLSLAKGEKDAPACAGCHGAHLVLPVEDVASSVNHRNLPRTCGLCHADVKLVKKYEIPIPAPLASYEQSVHGRALYEKGLVTSAGCSDCHESHDLRPVSDPRSLIYKTNIPSTCGKCHFEVYQTYERSVHGKALRAGLLDAPSCTDCHGEHSIKEPHDKASKVYGAQISKTTCPWCHSAERIVDRYGIVAQRLTSYLDTYHGVASRAGSKVAANCASCHGYHDILPSSDSLSSVAKTNLPRTCGKCHPNAGENFAKGSVHLVATPTTREALSSLGGVVIYWVRKIYIWLIVAVIGGMILHNTLVMGRRLIEHYHRKASPAVVRFTPAETVQHILLTASFILLVFSGFAFHFPDSWWVAWLVKSEAGFKIRSWTHRVSAVILVAASLWHIAYLFVTKQGRMEIRALLPGLGDLREFLHNMAYILGLRKDRPRYDRYDYTQKAEYWALIWGTVVMTLTGIPMWFPDFFMRFLAKWLLDVSRVIHYYEAWLASLAILVWHLYYMIFDPEAYPMNWTWLTGRIPEEAMKHEHPKEYERLLGPSEEGRSP